MNETALRIVNGHLGPNDSARDEGGGEDGDVRSCPLCAATDTVVKAASIARSGRFRFRLASGEVGECETELARLLAQPPEPRLQPLLHVFSAVVVSWLFLALDLLVIESLRFQDLVTIPGASLDVAFWLGLIWFGLLVPALALARFVESWMRRRSELPLWREALDRWQGLYYCTFDDVVFDRRSGSTPLAPDRAFQLWWPRSETAEAATP